MCFFLTSYFIIDHGQHWGGIVREYVIPAQMKGEKEREREACQHIRGNTWREKIFEKKRRRKEQRRGLSACIVLHMSCLQTHTHSLVDEVWNFWSKHIWLCLENFIQQF
jgi:hypothetical protein